MEKKETRAIAKSLRISPFRARLVVDLIKGKNIATARAILMNTNKKAARLTLKVLNSAVANAKENLKLNEESLFVKDARADAGMVMKRIKFDSRGHTGRKDHSLTHITVVVKER